MHHGLGGKRFWFIFTTPLLRSWLTCDAAAFGIWHFLAHF
jgi:hypothetical protein